MDLIGDNRFVFLLGFPLIMLAMLYLSALLGFKWQGIWLNSPINSLINKAPRPLRLVMSSTVGAVTPFCSCTTIPGFAIIIESGLGLDTAMAFLIASPTIDPAGTLLLALLFGVKLTAVYTIGCFTVSIIGGWLLGRIFTVRDVNPLLLFNCTEEDNHLTWTEAASRAWLYIRRFWWVVVASTAVGFTIYDYVPSEIISSVPAWGNNFAVPLAAVAGVFVYAHLAVLIPIGTALLAKGMAPGIVLAFLASSAGISPPEIMLLLKMVSFRLTVSYIIITLTLISLMGFMANMIGK